MDLQRAGNRTRRRRVLLDGSRAIPEKQLESSDSESTSEDNGESQTTPRARYTAAAREAEQPPITCLIPKRPATLVVLGLLSLTALTTIECLYVKVFWQAGPLRSVLPALDVTARGSLATWFSGAMLTGAGLAALFVYHLRRHKVDDYRGRYRIWIWTSLLLFAAGLDAATGLHEALPLLLSRSWGDRFSVPETWVVCAVAPIFVIASLRITWEMWGARLALTSLLLGVICHGVASAQALQLWQIPDQMLLAAAGSTLFMAGNLFLGGATISYCRYVFLQAQLLEDPSAVVVPAAKPSRPKKAAARKTSAAKDSKPAAAETRAKTAETKKASRQKAVASAKEPAVKSKPAATPTKSAAGNALRVDSAHAQQAERAQHSEATSSPAEEFAEAEARPRKLSKAERRRQRKESRRRKHHDE